MELFIEKDGMPVVNPEVKMIPEFNELFRRDKGSPGDSEGRKKLIANKTLAYIAMMYRPLSVFPELRIADRHKRVKTMLRMPEEWEVDSLVEACIEIYKKETHTFSVGLLEDALEGGYKVREYFRDVNLSEETEKGALKYKASDLVRNLKDVGGVIAGLQELRENIRKEQSDTTVIRGGGMLGRDEDPR